MWRSSQRGRRAERGAKASFEAESILSIGRTSSGEANLSTSWHFEGVDEVNQNVANVVHALSVNNFKSKLDAYWSNQEMMYNYQAEISGTGSRSVIT